MKHPILTRSVSLLLALVMLMAYPASAAEITALTDADTTADSSSPFDESNVEESSGETTVASTTDTASDTEEDTTYLDEDGNYLAPENLVAYVNSYLTEGKNARTDDSYTGVVAFYDYNETDEEEMLDNPYFFYYEDGTLQDEEELYISSDRFLNLTSAPTTAAAASVSNVDDETLVYSAEEVYVNYQDEEATEHPEYLFAFNVEGQTNGLYTGYSDVMAAVYEEGETVTVTGLAVTQKEDGTTPTISWTALSGASSYTVYRKAGSGSWSSSPGVTATSYTDTKATSSGTTYSYYVIAVLSDGEETSASSTVTYTYHKNPTVTISSQAGGLQVSWNKDSSATGYRIYRKTSSTSWQTVGDVTSGSTTSYVDTGAVSGQTYYYAVRAYYGSSIASSSNYKINDWSGYTSSASLLYIATPKMGTTYYNNAGGITVSWGKVSGVTGYRVFRRTSTSDSWTRIATISNSSTTSYLDTGVKSTGTYYYTVRAYFVDSKGTTTLSGYQTPGATYNYNGVPTVTAKAATTGVNVSWNKDSSATGYRVYRSTTGTGSWTVIANVTSGSTTSYVDTTAANGKTYYYTVRAYYGSNLQNDSNYKTNLWSGYKSSSSIYFVKAAQLSTIYSTTDGMQLTWTAISGASGYRLYRRSSTSDSWTRIATITNGKTSSYVDTSVKANGTYYYTIRTYITNSDGKTVLSAYETPTSASIYRTTPTVTSVATTSSGVKVTWTKDSKATGYRVYRKLAGGSWVVVANVTGGSTTSYVDSNAALTSGKTYYYTVRAYYGSSSSMSSDVAYKTNNWSSHSPVKFVYLSTPVLPDTTVNNGNNTNGIKVTWEKVTGAAGYYVYRRTSTSAKWTKIATVSSGSTVTYLDTSVSSLSAGTTCYYTVRAFDSSKSWLSYYDTSGSMCIYLPMAENLTVGEPSSSGTKVTWSKVGGASYYYVYRRESGVSSWTYLGTVTTNSYTDTTVTGRSTIYYYCVVAVATATVEGQAVTFRGTYNKTGSTFAIAWSGSERNTWVKKDGKQYYVNSDGTLATGWQYKKRNGSTYKYYFDPSSGELVTNLYAYFGKSYRDVKCRIVTCVCTSSSTPSYTAIYLYNSDTGAYDTPAAAWKSVANVSNTTASASSLYLSAGSGFRWLESTSSYEQYVVRIHGLPSYFHSVLYNKTNVNSLRASSYNSLANNKNNTLACIRMQCIYAFLISDLMKNGYGKTHRVPVVLYKTSSVSAFGVPQMNKISTSKKYDPTDPAVTGKFFYATTVYDVSTTASSTTWVYY